MDTMDMTSQFRAGVSSDERLQIFLVPPTHVDKAWKEGACKLATGLLRYSPECTPDQLKYRLARQELLLLSAARKGETPEAWAAVSFVQYPMFRCMCIYSIFAPRLSIPYMFEQLKEFAALNGASAIEGQADEAVARLWARKFGFSEVARTVRLFL